ncbi:MFS transporter [Massilia sp. W12]|uniref:MFS transporter n=1 Tax=Massilia sp. W12 TaxID=3126507 RepID=UPI0030D170CF
MKQDTRHFAHASYGLLGLPLAMAALPVYVQIPAYYTTQLGAPLAATGLLLFFARLIDTVQDPWLGRLIDRYPQHLKAWLICAGCILAGAFFGLWLPPRLAADSSLLAWLGLMLIIAYTGHSMLNIAYLAWGARLGETQMQLRASAWREGLGLLGVISASLMPFFILQGAAGQIRGSLLAYTGGFALILLLALLMLWNFAPRWQSQAEEHSIAWRVAFANPGFTGLLPIYFLNSLAAAIPATLALFFIADRIVAEKYGGLFLALYFVAAAIGLPAWVRLARQYGSQRAWQAGMLLAMSGFIGAVFLEAGDIWPYAMVCLICGLALGSDLALPPVMLAAAIPQDASAASYYGVWSLLGKLALACAGLALPLLAALGYQQGGKETIGLSIVYAAVPCLLKLCAYLLLRRYRINGVKINGVRLD